MNKKIKIAIRFSKKSLRWLRAYKINEVELNNLITNMKLYGSSESYKKGYSTIIVCFENKIFYYHIKQKLDKDGYLNNYDEIFGTYSNLLNYGI